jgi:hypothetical protein|tara:strand:+ start:1944 stop:2663 length:720 start_codon:yes stop_codon:yes gene_type:complete
LKKFFLATFILIFFIAGITLLRLPLSLVSPTVKELFPQVSYTSMEGTIWSGRINNLSFADEYLGSLNTSFNLRNLSFLVDERGLFLEGNINLISTILNNQVSLEDINLNLNSKRFLRKVPVISSVSGEKISIIFDVNGCYFSEGNIYASLRQTNKLDQLSNAKLSGTISCKDTKMLGSFFSTPKDDVLKGTFELDKELNYVVIANSKRLFAKITSFFESGFTSSPDVKLRGNLFDFFQD